MGVNKVLLLLALTIYGTRGITDKNEVTTESLIRHELFRFEEFQKEIAEEKLNVTVLFTQTRFDEDSDFVQFDSVGFQPLLGKDSIKKLDVLEPLDEKSIDLIFEFAKRFNFSAVVSQEKFAQDGSIISKCIYDDDMTISYKNGNSSMIYKDKEVKLDNEDISSFVKVVRAYEIPVNVHKVLYNEEGEVVKTDDMEYKPQKVKILEAHDLNVDNQMRVSEALKRTIVMKEDPMERMSLLCKYLGIQYPSTKWEAVIGTGNHYVKHFGLVKLLLEGEVYTVYKTSSDSDDDDDDE